MSDLERVSKALNDMSLASENIQWTDTEQMVKFKDAYAQLTVVVLDLLSKT